MEDISALLKIDLTGSIYHRSGVNGVLIACTIIIGDIE